jgi:branched-subunit amino acid aminotransferase/4-amino-4-deoxychorismate lyase
LGQISFVDGKILRGNDSCIPVDDLGLQRGYAVFDYARVCNGKIFHFGDHLSRLRRSAAGLQLALRYSDEEIHDAAMQLISMTGLKSPGLRFILTGGPAHAPTLLEKPRFIMVAEELPQYPNEIYTAGAKLATYEFRRDLPDVKTTNYMNAFRLMPFKQQRMAFDILYCWNGKVLECPRDNFFILHGDTLITAEAEVLHGITRRVVIDLAGNDFDIDTRDVAVNELDAADEAFMTSTTKQVVPVVQIDEWRLSGGAVGERTKRIMALFRNYVDNY